MIAAIVLGGAAGKSTMPTVSQYLKSPNAEIALARTAAPASISNDATVMILTAHGYTVAVKGRNGFTCLVDRAWMHLNIPTSWNLKIQNPVCYNAAASRTVLLYTLKRTILVLNGATEAQIEKTVSDAIAAKTLPPAAPDSIAYMMSKEQYIDDTAKSWYPHLMFFMPQADGDKVGETWGADRSRSPVVYDPHFSRFHDPWAQFFIPVSHWSDGSPAPLYSGT
ncbi:MAG: hypothetical protein JO092_02910 [Candidatus Eremiobacteraeota bacterium]|nr:hypothetical protein [Candidatus Eremiobacteraeota bacterium]